MANPRFTLPDLNSKDRTLVLRVSFVNVRGYDSKTMRFDPLATVEEVIVELAGKCEIGKKADQYCVAFNGDILPPEKTLRECGLNPTDQIQFKPKPFTELRQAELIKAIDDNRSNNRKILSFRDQGLRYVPTYIRMLTGATVTRIDLTNNNLTELPKEIGYLTQLRELAAPQNELTTLPPEIGYLTNMQRLFLSKNKLTSLPPELGLCTQLQEINIRENQLKSLPRQLGFLFLEYLQQLHFFGNPLHETMPVQVLGEGPKAIGRWLRARPESAAETPNLPDLPYFDPDDPDAKQTQKFIMRKVKPDAKPAIPSSNAPVKATVNADAASSNTGPAKPAAAAPKAPAKVFFSPQDEMLMAAADAEGKGAYAAICARLDEASAQLRLSDLRTQFSFSMNFVLSARGGEKLSRLLVLLTTKTTQQILDNLGVLYKSATAAAMEANNAAATAASSPAPVAVAAAPVAVAQPPPPVPKTTTAAAPVAAPAASIVAQPVTNASSASDVVASLQDIAAQLEQLAIPE